MIMIIAVWLFDKIDSFRQNSLHRSVNIHYTRYIYIKNVRNIRVLHNKIDDVTIATVSVPIYISLDIILMSRRENAKSHNNGIIKFFVHDACNSTHVHVCVGVHERAFSPTNHRRLKLFRCTAYPIRENSYAIVTDT